MPPDEEKFSSWTADITAVVVILIIALAVLGFFFGKIFDAYSAVIDWIYAQDWDILLIAITIVFSIINIGLIVFIAYIVRQYLRLREEPWPHEVAQEKPIHVITPKEEVWESWKGIQELLASPNPSDWNMAVLRADALLDEVLRRMGHEGDTIADRLKIVSPIQVPSLDRLWEAHRLRNVIAHEPLEQRPRDTISYAIRSFEEGLIELGMLERKPRENP